MELIKMYRVAEVKCKRTPEGKNEIFLFDNNLYPKFSTYEDASEWIGKPENYQNEWTIIEVYINKKYLI